MAELQAACQIEWKDAASVQAVCQLEWKDASSIQSVGSPYTRPSVGGGTPIDTGNTTPAFDIKSKTRYETLHTFVVTDLRTSLPLKVDSVSMSLDDGSVFWQLNASAPYETIVALNAGDQPAQVQLSINGQSWRFVVETKNAPRAFASSKVTFGGRSIAALADSPHQFSRQWINDAPTTAAQFATLAQTFTGLDVDWRLDDWLVPEFAWSITGTPWNVVQQAAAAVGAVVDAHKTDFKVKVSSRYPIAPNLWATSRPDVQIAWNAIESDATALIDQPAIDAVLVAGQVGGAALVRLAGTSGANQGPMITDPLLTDQPAFVERGRVALSAAGGGVMVTRTLQILAGAGEPGVVERGALVRWVDPAETWVGMVRAVSVTADFQSARQTVACERRTKFVVGSVAPPPIVYTDPHFAKVISLLHFDDAENSVIPVDVVLGVVWSNSGNSSSTAISTAKASSAKFGAAGWRHQMSNGISGGLRYTFAGLPAGLFTLEGWIRITSAGTFGTTNHRFASLEGNGDNTLLSYNSSTGTLIARYTETTAVMPLNQWHHVAICNTATQSLFFLNGTLAYAQSSPSIVSGNVVYCPDNNLGNGAYYNGDIDEFRLTWGIARYPTDFIPPVREFPSR